MSDELNFNAPGGTDLHAPRADDESTQRRQKLVALLRGRLHWAIILSIVLSLMFGFIGFKAVRPMYRSDGEVKIELDPLMFSNVQENIRIRRWKSFLGQQEDLILSENVALRAMATTAWQQRGTDAESWEPLKFAKAIELEMDENDSNDNTIKIFFAAADAVTAVAGNHALLQAYTEEFANQAKAGSHARIGLLKKQVLLAQQEIAKQMSLRGTVVTNAEYGQLDTRIKALIKEQIELELAINEARSQIDSRDPLKSGMMPSSADLITSDKILAGWQREKESLEEQIAVLEADGKGPGHGLNKRLASQLDVVKSRMGRRLSLLMGDVDGPVLQDDAYEQLKQIEKVADRQLKNVKSTLARLSQQRGDVVRYQQVIDSKEAIVFKASKQIDEINVELESIAKTITVNIHGLTPLEPFNGGKAKQVAALGGMAGLFMGFGVVMGVGMLDRRLRHAGDARMGLPTTRMLGILPTLPENFADPEQSEKAAHAVHHIRTLLQIFNRGSARVFSITSPASGSGKSSLSVAMGLSFAASESKTLVIDCDLIGAGLTRRVGAVVNRTVESILREDTVLTDEQVDSASAHARSKGINVKDALVELGMLTKKDLQRLNRRQADSALGILDACQGRPFSECVASTGIENFSVLPVGAAKPQDVGLLSPKALRGLINRAREEYDIVLIDTGPCLGSLEASMASAESDATVLILSRGDSKSMAIRAHEHLTSVGANVVGIVFNHALDVDLNHSSFASIVSQERRTDPAQSLLAADPVAAARFGPLGSAVAAFGTPSKSPNGKPRKHVAAANGLNGH